MSDVEKKDIRPRKALRYKPDPKTVAYLDFKVSKNFTPQFAGLVINESFTGCALIIITDLPIKKGAKLKAKVGDLAMMKAKVAWVRILEENILKLGINFME